ncbi:hypothetical protein LC653_17995 [Nostoc sp. CHAB 5784]|uniref:hypothetical protein n=1 Tax=Nostoc mirabile TaxID=2907820 RepID=UPI001E63EF66|nr:hypothetical protein [Nostoc mirabile]MCC5665761.1 hypothetical protein [Nostoc mirabile CHAB5784]
MTLVRYRQATEATQRTQPLPNNLVISDGKNTAGGGASNRIYKNLDLSVDISKN